jgi:gamma-glutamylcyclotransferase
VGDVIRYFAYGSNLMAERMRERGVELVSARPAVLRDHRLAVDRAGGDGAGRASLTRLLGGQVHGVLYELAPGGLEALEGLEPGYDVVDVLVECSRLDGGVEVLAARTLMARADRREEAPPARGEVAAVPEELRQRGLPEAGGDEVEQDPGRTKPQE